MRLYPEYIAVVLGATVIFIITKEQFPGDFFWYLTSLQNILWINTQYLSDIQFFTAHTWTLAIEVQLGIIWVIFLKIVPKNKIPILCIICIGAVLRFPVQPRHLPAYMHPARH